MEIVRADPSLFLPPPHRGVRTVFPTLVPENYEDMSKKERRSFIVDHFTALANHVGPIQNSRNEVCVFFSHFWDLWWRIHYWGS